MYPIPAPTATDGVTNVPTIGITDMFVCLASQFLFVGNQIAM
jgi:hypothetical protein